MSEETKCTYPGITRILEDTQSQRTKNTLAAWRLRVGEQEAERKSQEGLKRGRHLDDLIQKYIKTGETGDIEIDNYLEPFEILESEKKVISEVYKYQGRLDAKLRNEGNIFITDWKTKGKPMNQRWLNDYPIQLSAYCNAEVEAGNEYTGAMIVVFSPGFPIQEVQQFYFSRQQMEMYFTEFKVRLAQYNQLNK